MEHLVADVGDKLFLVPHSGPNSELFSQPREGTWAKTGPVGTSSVATECESQNASDELANCAHEGESRACLSRSSLWFLASLEDKSRDPPSGCPATNIVFGEPRAAGSGGLSNHPLHDRSIRQREDVDEVAAGEGEKMLLQTLLHRSLSRAGALVAL